jgi:glycosyltransferase involved in cell wall biosynthesis
VNIALVGPAYPHRGGIAQFLAILYHHLVRTHTVSYFSFTRQYPGFLFPGQTQLETATPAVRVNARPMLDSIDPVSWIRTGRAIRASGADVVVFKWWTPFFGPSFGTVARIARRPRGGGRARVVFICDNALPHERRPVDLPFTRYAFGAVDGFIVMSDSVRQDLLRLLPPRRHRDIAYVPHPVYQQFGPLPCDRAEARRRLNLPADHDVLLAFGYQRPYKGTAVLLDALPHVRKARAPRGVTALVVGEFYEPRAPYDERARRNGVEDMVRFVDRYIPDDEVGLYFAAADVVVLPYTSATQSGVVQLAYGFGRPVITTSVGGLPEVVRDGVTGFLVPPNDPNALAGAIARFYVAGSPERWEANVTAERDRYGWEPLADAIVAFARETA